MVARVWIGIALTMVLACSSRAWSYEADVHFSLTYALCKASGYHDSEALAVASADEGMDLNASTRAWPVASWSFMRKNRLWHAFGRNRSVVLKRRDELWERAVSAHDLVKLGQFLHFEQDMYSHRRKLGTDWQPYGELLGHVLQGNAPDRIPYHVELAKEMARETASYLCRFEAAALNRPPVAVSASDVDHLVDLLAAAYPRITGRIVVNSKRPTATMPAASPGWGPADIDQVSASLNVPPPSTCTKYRFSADGDVISSTSP